MTHIPPKGAQVDLWMLYSYSTAGTFIEDIFTHKTQAEAALREFRAECQNNATFRLVERRTQPHGEGQ
jgi:hypothetical protein